VQLTLEKERSGHLVCSVAAERQEATVTASNVPEAVDQLMAACEGARDTGYGECLWLEAGGEYRWMLRRTHAATTVVILWSSGTLTGWQHVFRTECDIEPLLERVRAEWARLSAG
jgi:hypothetical protein